MTSQIGFVADSLAALPRAERLRLPVGERVRINDRELHLVFVANGALGRVLPRKGGGQVILQIHGTGSWLTLPDGGARDGSPRLELRVLSPADLIVVPFREVAVTCVAREDLATSLVRLNEREEHRLRERVAGLTERDPQRRLAATALYLAHQLNDYCPLRTGGRIAFSQSVIAAAAGLARQTVNRILQRWSRSGWIVLESRMVCVLDPEALRHMALGNGARSRGVTFCCALLHPQARCRCTGAGATEAPRTAGGPRRGARAPASAGNEA